MFKKVSLSTLVVLLPMWSMGSEFLGNWTQYYMLSNSEGKTFALSHTPKVVCFNTGPWAKGSVIDCASQSLYINDEIQGVMVENLDVLVNSTQEEFESDIERSNLRVVKQSKTELPITNMKLLTQMEKWTPARSW